MAVDLPQVGNMKYKKSTGSKKEKRNWPKWIDEHLENHPVKMNLFPLMKLSCDYYRGSQDRYYDESSGTVKDLDEERENVSRYNFTNTFVDVCVAKMLRGNPEPRFEPFRGNAERDDRDRAIALNAITERWWEQQDMSLKQRIALTWAFTTGSVFSRTYFNRVGGDKYDISPDDAERYGVKDLRKGCVEHMVLNPMSVYEDITTSCDRDMRFAVIKYPVPRIWAEDKFNKKRDHWKADDKSDRYGSIQVTSDRINDTNRDEHTVDGETVYMKEVYMKPCGDYPNGRHVMVIQEDVLVSEGFNPDKRPVLRSVMIDAPFDEYRGRGYVKRIIDPQRDYNKANSLYREHLEVHGLARTFVDNSKLMDKLSDDPRDLIRVNGSPREAVHTVPPVPASGIMQSAPEETYKKAQRACNLSPLDFSQMPDKTSQAPYVLIQDLKQSSQDAFSKPIEEYYKYVKGIVWDMINLHVEHFTEDELVDLVGEEYRPKIKKLLTEDFDPKRYDVKLSVGSGFAETPGARIKQIQELVQAQILPPTAALKAIAEFADVGEIYEDSTLDRRLGERLLDRMLDGEDPSLLTVSKHANHQVIMQVFMDFTKTAEYEHLSKEQGGLEIRLAIDDFIDNMIDHIQRRQMQMQMAQMQMMQALGNRGQGAGGGQPQQPQPQGFMDQMAAHERMQQSPGPPQTAAGDGNRIEV